MYLHLLGFDFRNSTSELRETLYTPAGNMTGLLKETIRACEWKEVFWLTTCHRVECYMVCQSAANETFARFAAWLTAQFDLPSKNWREECLHLSGKDAARHLLKVASSLDSMLVGEPQILGQVKQAYRQALQAKTLGPVLQSLLEHAFHTAKRVRSETQVAINPLSIGQVSAQLARKIFGSLKDKCLLLLGAGKMAQLAALELKKDGLQHLRIASRTLVRAQALAEQVQGQPLSFANLDNALAASDIILGASSASYPLITQNMTANALKTRKGQPIFFIDIAMPHDIDPAVNNLANAYRYDLEDLQGLAQQNRLAREQEASKALKLVEIELDLWLERQQEMRAAPLVRALRNHVTQLGEAELQRTLTALRHQDPSAARMLETNLRKMMHRFIRNLLHIPSTKLKRMVAQQALPAEPDSFLHETGEPLLSQLPVLSHAQALAELFELQPLDLNNTQEQPTNADSSTTTLESYQKRR